MSCGPHQFSPHWIGVSTSRAMRAWPGVIVRERGLLDPGQAFPVETMEALNGVGRRQRLIIVDHQRHFVADRSAHRAHYR